MRIFATEFTVIGRCDYSIADTDLFTVDLVVALGGDVECLFLTVLKMGISLHFVNILKTLNI